jgi:hypothetical protein
VYGILENSRSMREKREPGFSADSLGIGVSLRLLAIKVRSTPRPAVRVTRVLLLGPSTERPINRKRRGKEEGSGLRGPHLSVLQHCCEPCNRAADALTHGRHFLRFIKLCAEDVVSLRAFKRMLNYCGFLTYFLCPIHHLLPTSLFFQQHTLRIFWPSFGRDRLQLEHYEKQCPAVMGVESCLCREDFSSLPRLRCVPVRKLCLRRGAL